MEMSITLPAQPAKDVGREDRRVEVNQPVAPKRELASVSSMQRVQAADSTQSANPTAEVSKQQVEAAVGQMKDFAQAMSRQLQFDVDEESGRTVVRVLDKDSGEIIRQIPSDEILALARHMKELMEEDTAKISGKGGQDQPVGLLVTTQA
jgi:flagellar protein FlaG